jgi:hypothetical protein
MTVRMTLLCVVALAGCAAPGAGGSTLTAPASPSAAASTTATASATPPASATSEPSTGTVITGVIRTEDKPKGTGSAVPACTTQGEFEVRLVLDRDADPALVIGALVHPEEFPEFPDGFGPIIWPFGFTADPGPPFVIRDHTGTVVGTEDQVVRLGGGVMDEAGYHVCVVDGMEYFGGPVHR